MGLKRPNDFKYNSGDVKSTARDFLKIYIDEINEALNALIMGEIEKLLNQLNETKANTKLQIETSVMRAEQRFDEALSIVCEQLADVEQSAKADIEIHKQENDNTLKTKIGYLEGDNNEIDNYGLEPSTDPVIYKITKNTSAPYFLIVGYRYQFKLETSGIYYRNYHWVAYDEEYEKDIYLWQNWVKCDPCTANGGFAGGLNASANYGAAIGLNASAGNGGAIGVYASAGNGGAIGVRATSEGSGFAGGATAHAGTVDSIQLGRGDNTEAYTLGVYHFKMMNADGSIPIERLSKIVEQFETKVIYSNPDDTLIFFNASHLSERRITGNPTSITLNYIDDVYPDTYISGLVFDSGETPTSISYPGTGIINWVGTDCSKTGDISLFIPSANTHYDIVFYFNGSQVVGLVNGFVPATGNVTDEVNG